MRFLVLGLLVMASVACSKSNGTSNASASSKLYRAWYNPNGRDANDIPTAYYMDLTPTTYQVQWHDGGGNGPLVGCICDMTNSGDESAGTLSMSNCKTVADRAVACFTASFTIPFTCTGDNFDDGNSTLWTPR